MWKAHLAMLAALLALAGGGDSGSGGDEETTTVNGGLHVHHVDGRGVRARVHD